MSAADRRTLASLLPLHARALPSLHPPLPPRLLEERMASADSPSLGPFLASPRGVLGASPRSLGRSLSFGGGGPADILKAGLVHNRNEIVMLFTRCGMSLGRATPPAQAPAPAPAPP